MSFERLFHPRGIAIIGASADPTRIGGHPVRALARAGFKGGIYPVNPKYAEIAGLKCHPDVSAIGAPCDVAIVAVPPSQNVAEVYATPSPGDRHKREKSHEGVHLAPVRPSSV